MSVAPPNSVDRAFENDGPSGLLFLFCRGGTHNDASIAGLDDFTMSGEATLTLDIRQANISKRGGDRIVLLVNPDRLNQDTDKANAIHGRHGFPDGIEMLDALGDPLGF